MTRHVITPDARAVALSHQAFLALGARAWLERFSYDAVVAVYRERYGTAPGCVYAVNGQYRVVVEVRA
jgi:hypothetical protein